MKPVEIKVIVSTSAGYIAEFSIKGTISGLTANEDFINNMKRIQSEYPNETLRYTAFKE